ncbi:MAG TPA: hypothetical protein VME67_04630 [Mycobacterium sp.]|nr:hypothetical protein [Mycobacterium sp.]HTX94178.1 hypothetical protein [Mycobacterium sp.]
MLVSSAEVTGKADAVDEPLPQSPSAGPAVKAPSTEVLITTQQVVFSTAAARGTRRPSARDRFVAMVRRMWATPL